MYKYEYVNTCTYDTILFQIRKDNNCINVLIPNHSPKICYCFISEWTCQIKKKEVRIFQRVCIHKISVEDYLCRCNYSNSLNVHPFWANTISINLRHFIHFYTSLVILKPKKISQKMKTPCKCIQFNFDHIFINQWPLCTQRCSKIPHYNLF